MMNKFFLLLVLSDFTLADCTCDNEQDGGNKSQAIKYKVHSIASILVACAIGVSIPILGSSIPALHPDKKFFYFLKAFASSVILATRFIHVLPDAFDKLTLPCLNEDSWGKFPFSGFVDMIAAIGTLMVDSLASSYFYKSQLKKAENQNDGDEEQNDGNEEQNDGNEEENDGDQLHVLTHSTHGSIFLHRYSLNGLSSKWSR